MKIAKQPTAADVWQAFASIMIGVAILGIAFAWATDPRPVEGSPQCKPSAMLDYSQPAATRSWNEQRDCKRRVFG